MSCIAPDKTLFIPRDTLVAGYYDIMLAVCVSLCVSIHLSVIHPSIHPYFSFPDNNLSKHHWIFIDVFIGVRILRVNTVLEAPH